MADAYATLADGGERLSGTMLTDGVAAPISIARVTDAQGNVLVRNTVERSRVLQRWQAGLETSILQQVIERGTGRAAAIGRPAAGKTGTTTNYADAWFCGYTPDLAAAVWVGYPGSQREMIVRGIRVAGGTFPAMIWSRFAQNALAERAGTRVPVVQGAAGHEAHRLRADRASSRPGGVPSASSASTSSDRRPLRTARSTIRCA